MKIEILFFRGCPNHRAAVERLHEVLRQENARAEIEEIEVSGSTRGFPGSPTIRVNGQDIEPNMQTGHDSGLSCRTYFGPAGPEGAPPVELIRQAVRKAMPCPPPG